jgi:D-3-phosphoglycerate dehydrogenase
MSKRDGVRFLSGVFKKALILENPSTELDRLLEEQGIEADRLPESATLDREAVIQRLRDGQHDLIFKRSRFEVDEEVLQASDNLAAVMLCCIGDDSVDKEACAREGILVMNDPVSNGRSVVEMVFGEMICMARRIFHAVERTRESEWTKDNHHRYEIMGKNLSIIGLGNIGKAVAQMAEVFGMNVYFYDTKEVAREVGSTLGWKACKSMEEAFRVADIVTVHVSAEDHRGRTNKNLLTYDHFSKIGADRGDNSPRIFINAARGFLFDPADLKQAVADGKVSYASIDVYPEEPGSKSDVWVNPYADFSEIVGTPHIGAATQEAQPRIGHKMAYTTQLFNCYGSVRDTVLSPGNNIGVEGSEPRYILTVVHSDARGTKKAVSDAIFDAGLNNLESAHRDFTKYGIAYDISALDKPLTEDQLMAFVESARSISGDRDAIRAVRLIEVGKTSCG